ncbi:MULTISPECIES: glyoxalase [unclassified Streptomyces]|uniref:glyoxalase n=1 Tax=unclassified Streptomyces TaxID=2593676 RepID=UPI00166021BB|nr:MULTISPECIES: glyoxalase [unclassified Streptomyces]MBD0709066.1 glyoxalase [Streptomyces sp. CBMA291]MBD0716216.1 glyoxalase [Streptomyces sp. CBMA370]
MNSKDSAAGGNALAAVTLEVDDLPAAERFHAEAGLAPWVRLRASTAPTSGFRGFALSLTVSQPGDVRLLFDAAVDAGATPLKPVSKSFWGYGGVFRAPDGTAWKIATSAKKDTGPVTGKVDRFVVLLGASDVAASKSFYVGHGLAVAKSFGRKYADFEAGGGIAQLALYGRRALAKDLGVPADGEGAHRIALGGSSGGAFTDPDGFAWEPADA